MTATTVTENEELSKASDLTDNRKQPKTGRMTYSESRRKRPFGIKSITGNTKLARPGRTTAHARRAHMMPISGSARDTARNDVILHLAQACHVIVTSLSGACWWWRWWWWWWWWRFYLWHVVAGVDASAFRIDATQLALVEAVTRAKKYSVLNSSFLASRFNSAQHRCKKTFG